MTEYPSQPRIHLINYPIEIAVKFDKNLLSIPYFFPKQNFQLSTELLSCLPRVNKISDISTRLIRASEMNSENVHYLEFKSITDSAARNQRPGEGFESYYTELRNTVKDCEFGSLEENLLRDRLVCGIIDEIVREKLLQVEDLTLEKCVNMCRLFESNAKQLRTLGSSQPEPDVHALRKMKLSSKTGQRHTSGKQALVEKQTRQKLTSNKPCDYCSYKHVKGKCLAFGKFCKGCGQRGHFYKAKKCKLAKNDVNQVELEEVQYDEPVEEDYFFVGTLTNENSNSSYWKETLNVEGHPISFKLDTGAETDILSTELFRSLNSGKKLQDTKVKLRSYSGNIMIPQSQATLIVVTSQGLTKHLTFQVVDGKIPVLGRDSCVSLGLIKRVTPEVDVTSVDYLVPGPEPSVQSNQSVSEKHQPSKFCLELVEHAEKAGIFDNSTLGTLSGKEYHIKLLPDAMPVQNPPRTIPHKIRDEVKQELDRMEHIGVHCQVKEPSAWVNSMHIVYKPGKTRVCLDPRDLNQYIMREHYPMPTVEEVAACMPGAIVFSCIDASSGYWQIPLDEESSYLTTYNTPFGRYRYLRMPFGISSASELWQCSMEEEFGDIEGAEIIVGDLVVWGRNDEERDKRLEQVLERALKSGLKLNRKKCKFSVNRITYVGHIFSSNGLEPNPERVEAIVDMPEPNSKEELATFMGMITYLGKFVQNLSAVSAPLRELTQKGVAWSWEVRHQEAFNELKQRIAMHLH